MHLSFKCLRSGGWCEHVSLKCSNSNWFSQNSSCSNDKKCSTALQQVTLPFSDQWVSDDVASTSVLLRNTAVFFLACLRNWHKCVITKYTEHPIDVWTCQTSSKIGVLKWTKFALTGFITDMTKVTLIRGTLTITYQSRQPFVARLMTFCESLSRCVQCP